MTRKASIITFIPYSCNHSLWLEEFYNVASLIFYLICTLFLHHNKSFVPLKTLLRNILNRYMKINHILKKVMNLNSALHGKLYDAQIEQNEIGSSSLGMI